MKLYTRSGDQGKTGLFGGQRVSKAHIRVHAYGELDELNSLLGMVRAAEGWKELDEQLLTIQQDLLSFGSHLATPEDSPFRDKLPILRNTLVQELEEAIDKSSQAVPPLTTFILPGGSWVASLLLYARCVCRRAERSCVQLNDQTEHLPDMLISYLNRLSDLLFAWGREANQRAGVQEAAWQPKTPS